MVMRKHTIEVRHITRTFGEVKAVDDVSLSVEEGELFGLLGPNGSGKTTMVRIMTGQLMPTSGTVRVLAMDVTRHPVEIRRHVGIIPEQEAPPGFLTAEEFLHFVARIRHIDGVDEKCDEWFSFLECEEERDMLCKDLSRGTKQKLMVAQAFLHDPPVAFVDEPLINLDPVIQRKVKDYFTAYVKRGGTLFFCTHVLEIAEELCTSIGIISRGKLIHKGPLREILERHSNLEQFFLELVRGTSHA